jgi:hypothetical protein
LKEKSGDYVQYGTVFYSLPGFEIIDYIASDIVLSLCLYRCAVAGFAVKPHVSPQPSIGRPSELLDNPAFKLKSVLVTKGVIVDYAFQNGFGFLCGAADTFF